jgi:hypothetical protein
MHKMCCSTAGGAGPNNHCESVDISRLHVHRSRALELTDQSLTGTETGDDSAAGDPFHHILAGPGYKVTVVYYIIFAFDELRIY